MLIQYRKYIPAKIIWTNIKLYFLNETIFLIFIQYNNDNKILGIIFSKFRTSNTNIATIEHNVMVNILYFDDFKFKLRYSHSYIYIKPTLQCLWRAYHVFGSKSHHLPLCGFIPTMFESEFLGWWFLLIHERFSIKNT